MRTFLGCESIAPAMRVEVRMFDPTIGSGTRFRKGVSGNPGGRPRTRLLSEALRTRLGEVKQGDLAGRTYAEIIATNLIEIACGEGPGAVHAANEIAGRIEGRPRQSIEVAEITAEIPQQVRRGTRILFGAQLGRLTKSESCCQRHRMPHQPKNLDSSGSLNGENLPMVR